VTAAMTWEFVGSISISMMDRDGCGSVRGVHVGVADVALVVVQIPPLTAPTIRLSAFAGSTTNVWVLPETSSGVACKPKFGTEIGPRSVQEPGDVPNATWICVSGSLLVDDDRFAVHPSTTSAPTRTSDATFTLPKTFFLVIPSSSSAAL